MPQSGVILLVLGVTLLGITIYELTLGGALGNSISIASIAQYAASAGFTGADLVTAVAIALAESAGNPNAQGDYGDPVAGQYNAFGLWQINTGENPQFAGQNLADPAVNASAAYALYAEAGNSFSPWSTFNSGKYQQFVSEAESAVSA